MRSMSCVGEVLQFDRDRPGAGDGERAGPSRRGAVTAARAGPTISAQSAIICAAAGARWRKAGRVRPGHEGADRRAGRRGAACRLAASASPCRPGALPDAAALLAWYDRHRRALPWRALPGEAADPYRVWLSEIMLQQTTVAAVVPYFDRFLRRFPTWRRWRPRLRTCCAPGPGSATTPAPATCTPAPARSRRPGGFPRDVDGLRALPGIGAYTAAAIAAIAFGVPAVPSTATSSGSSARVFAVDVRCPARAGDRRGRSSLGDDPAARARPADFAQALFDLGATICTPTRAGLRLCPWRTDCAGPAAGHRRRTAPQSAETGPADAVRRAFLAERPGRGAAAPPPAERACSAA